MAWHGARLPVPAGAAWPTPVGGLCHRQTWAPCPFLLSVEPLRKLRWWLELALRPCCSEALASLSLGPPSAGLRGWARRPSARAGARGHWVRPGPAGGWAGAGSRQPPWLWGVGAWQADRGPWAQVGGQHRPSQAPIELRTSGWGLHIRPPGLAEAVASGVSSSGRLVPERSAGCWGTQAQRAPPLRSPLLYAPLPQPSLLSQSSAEGFENVWIQATLSQRLLQGFYDSVQLLLAHELRKVTPLRCGQRQKWGQAAQVPGRLEEVPGANWIYTALLQVCCGWPGSQRTWGDAPWMSEPPGRQPAAGQAQDRPRSGGALQRQGRPWIWGQRGQKTSSPVLSPQPEWWKALGWGPLH